MILQDKFFTLLGFAAKAGACAYGAEKAGLALKKGKAKLLLADEAVSARSKADMETLAKSRGATLVTVSPPGRMAHACGKDGRMFVAVTKDEFADKLVDLYRDSVESAEV